MPVEPVGASACLNLKTASRLDDSTPNVISEESIEKLKLIDLCFSSEPIQSRYIVKKIIGEGGYGKVCERIRFSDGKNLALCSYIEICVQCFDQNIFKAPTILNTCLKYSILHGQVKVRCSIYYLVVMSMIAGNRGAMGGGKLGRF